MEADCRQYNVGCLYAVPGRPTDALRCLKKVVRSGWRKEWIQHDPDWAALRGMKEFEALVSPIRSRQQA